jgi:hypothetical protein
MGSDVRIRVAVIVLGTIPATLAIIAVLMN